MPHPGINEDIKKLIWNLVETHPKDSAGKTRVALRARGVPEDLLPSERTIARIKKAFSGKTAEERQLYKDLSWPASILDGSLPLESSEIVIKLLNFYRVNEGYGFRPTVLVAQWVWKLFLTAPDLDLAMMVRLAKRCAFVETASTKPKDAYSGVEAYLMIQPWKGEGHAKWTELKNKGEIPDLPSKEFDEYPYLETTNVDPRVKNKAENLPSTKSRKAKKGESR